MDSFFFNIRKSAYQKTVMAPNINKIDGTNGINYLDINKNFDEKVTFEIKNFDRLVAAVFVKKGTLTIKDNLNDTITTIKTKESGIFVSVRQDVTIYFKAGETEIFAIFVADFVLKRYLLENDNPINFLYKKAQENILLELIQKKELDALSFYQIEQILKINQDQKLASIKCENKIIELLIREFSLIDLLDDLIISDEFKQIASKAKNYLSAHFDNPPTIKELAHLCATNEFKLKIAFKQAYQITIHSYIQNLKLEKANKLLMDNLYSIGEIAKLVGYNHQGNFSKLFFEKFGVYPKDIKKSLS